MNTDFHWEIDQDGIAWLAVDKADAGTNVLTESILEQLDEVIVEIAQNHPQGLVIHSAKAGGFIAGADVKAFAQVNDSQWAERYIRRVHEIFQRIESLAFPSVAMVHGYCLGGGLELALACDYRVARDDTDTRIGFPEVRLGIFPGFGGTVRSLRAIGPLKALPLMLEGRTLSAIQAKRMGLVDHAVPGRQLRNTARMLIHNRSKIRRASLWQRLPGTLPFRPLVAAYIKRKLRNKVHPDHYPAPYALLDHWLRYGGNARALYDSEAREVARLLTSSTAQQLIRIFLLQDRLKGMGDKTVFTPRHVHVVGGGIMGGDIAAWCALRGMHVTLQDREPGMLGNAMARAHSLFQRRLKNPYRVQRVLDRLTPDCDGDGIPRADVVIEAIYENTEAKRELYARLEPRMREDALLATNTSSIPLEELARDLKRPERLVGLHFFNPVAKMPLLEVVHGADTAKDTLSQALAFARHIDKLPLPVSSSPGFLVNRVLMPYLLEAVNLLDQGHKREHIDKAALQFGMPMGPIELADTVGLDICLSVAEKLVPVIGGEIPEHLRKRVDAGHLGRKSGQGFYVWKHGHAVRSKAGTDKAPAEELAARMIDRLVAEAIACLRDGVVEDADLIDAGVVFGTGFAPFRGGPIHYLHTHETDDRDHRQAGDPAHA